MRVKRVVLRERGDRDADEAVDHHLREADEGIALGFVDALERACAHVARHPRRVHRATRTS